MVSALSVRLLSHSGRARGNFAAGAHRRTGAAEPGGLPKRSSSESSGPSGRRRGRRSGGAVWERLSSARSARASRFGVRSCR